jgi:hypothetical protein
MIWIPYDDSVHLPRYFIACDQESASLAPQRLYPCLSTTFAQCRFICRCPGQPGIRLLFRHFVKRIARSFP